MSQVNPPTFINLPPPNPDTPSEAPGTPTSTTTSLSAVSTTAIKDGHRGNLGSLGNGPFGRGHAQNPSLQSLEAERADRISRLAGLERVSALRAPAAQQAYSNSSGHAPTSPQINATSAGFSQNQSPYNNQNMSSHVYFDARGQPTAAKKRSTVGTASASSVAARESEDDARTTTEADQDDDMLSTDTDTNYRGEGASFDDGEGSALGARSQAGGFEDHMSDDGSASLVGFGEGANSTVSGPIYQRRPLPTSNMSHSTTGQQPPTSSAAAAAAATAGVGWTIERSASGYSDGFPTRREKEGVVPGDASTRVSDLVSTESPNLSGDDGFVDTSNRSPLPPATSAAAQAQFQRQQQQSLAASRETADKITSGLDGDGRVGLMPGDNGLGKFYFEDKKST